jgi:hypothetical protein
LKRLLLLLAPLFLLGSLAHAIDPSEIILTLDGAYARPLGPQRFADGYYGYGVYAQLEKALGPKYSVGVGFGQVSLTNQSGDRWGQSSLDLIGRRWFNHWKAFNPYFLVGIGGNLFKEAYKQPFGDVFHAQAALGSQYVFDTHWALDYAVDWHVMAPLDTPHHWAGARFGLSYRYGTQPHVNRIAPPRVQALAVEELSPEKVEEVVGKVEYTVKPGESLYRITGRKEHLSDPNLWPLVYDTNKELIRNPNLIQPGQEIIIRRNYSAEQAKSAKKKSVVAPLSGTASSADRQ